MSARLLGSKQSPRGNTGRPWTNKCSLKFAGNSCPASAGPGAARGVAIAAGEGGGGRERERGASDAGGGIKKEHGKLEHSIIIERGTKENG